MRRYTLLLCVVSGVVTASERATLFDLSLEDLVNYEISLPSLRKQSALESPSLSNLYLQDELSQQTGASLLDVLNRVPSLYIKMRPEGLYQVYIRGDGEFGNVLLMINGQPFKDFYDDHALFDLPAHLFERVEVLRGPSSALYGSSASGGVINLVTKTDNQVEAGIGDNDTQYLSGSFLNDKDILTALNVSLLTSSGEKLPITKAPTIDNTQFALQGETNRYVDQGIIQGNLKGSNWHLSGQYLYNKQGVWSSPEFSLGPDSTRKEQYASLFYEQNNGYLKDALTITPSLFVSHIHNHFVNQEVPANSLLGNNYFENGAFSKESYSGTHAKFDVKAAYQLSEQGFIIAGIEYNYQTLSDYDFTTNYLSDGFIPQAEFANHDQVTYTQQGQSRKVFAGFLQYQTPLFGGEWTLGARYDHYNDFGAAFSPRIAVHHPINEYIALKAHYGRAFRAPNFKELYDNTGVDAESVVGNPNLDAETSDTLEFGIQVQAGGVQSRLNVYQIKSDSLIRTFDPQGGGGQATKENIGNTQTQGIEIEVLADFNQHIRVDANVSWFKKTFEWDSDPQYQSLQTYLKEKGDDELYDTPRIQSNVNLRYKVSRFESVLNFNYVGNAGGNNRSPVERFSSVVPSLDTGEVFEVPASLLVSLSALYRFSDQLTVKFSVINLGEQRYASPDESTDNDAYGSKGLVQPSEQYRVGVQYEF